MKLHWSPRSPFVRKVMIFAHETGLLDRLECVRTVVAMPAANVDLLTENPLGKIPTLVLDDGTPLYDSGVICEYLDSLHAAAKLFPPQGSARWTALRWQALGDGFWICSFCGGTSASERSRCNPSWTLLAPSIRPR
jgi:glutathione S-transferase